MNLQEQLDEFKGKEVQGVTLFGKLNPLVPKPYAKFNTTGNENNISAPTVVMPIVDRLPRYVTFISKLTTVSELLAQLSESLKRPESEPCTIENCAGCGVIEDVLNSESAR